MASISERKRENGKSSFRVDIRKRGMPQITKSFDTREEAETFAKETEDSFNFHVKSFEVPNLPMDFWIDRYKNEELPLRKEVKRESAFLEFWSNQIGRQIAHKITPTAIEMAADCLLKKENGRGGKTTRESRRRYLLWLSHLYTVSCKKWRWCKESPFHCIEMRPEKKEKKSPKSQTDALVNFRAAMNKELDKVAGTDAAAARMCGLSKSTYQNLRAADSNPLLQNLIQTLDAFDLELKIVKREKLED